MSRSIDVTTHQLAEEVASYLQRNPHRPVGKIRMNLTVEDILNVWYSIGTIISAQLTQKKGVRLSSFGAFSLTAEGDPLFIMSNDLATHFKLRQRAQVEPVNIPITNLSLVQVSSNTEIPREYVDKVYEKMIYIMGKYVMEGRSVMLNINKVAEISICLGEITAKFRPEFINLLKGNISGAGLSSQQNRSDTIRFFSAQRSSAIQNDRTFMNKLSTGAAKPADNLTSFQIGSNNSDDGRTFGRARPQSAGRGGSVEKFNLITGERVSNRPGSASSQGSRPNSSSSVGSNPNQKRPSSAGRGRAAQPVLGAREIAAKALDGGKDVIQKVRDRIIERGGSNGIRSIAKLLSIMDDDGDKRLTKQELKYGLRDYGIELSPVELEQVFFYFDRDRNGFIDVTEFMVGIRGELNGKRKKLVRMAFDVLDVDKTGTVTMEEIMHKYDFAWHPEVRAGKKTVQDAAKEFMSQWDRDTKDAIISMEEFEDYYKDISASIDDDVYFELMIRNAWRITGGEGMAANTANRRVLVTNKDGSQSVQTIKNELGMKPKDMADIKARLQEQGIDGDYNVDLYGQADNRDKARNPNAKPVAGSNRNGARQAWDPQSEQPQQTQSSEDFQSEFMILKRLLYNPPVDLESFCGKLRVSMASVSPRIAAEAFLQIISSLDPQLSKSDAKKLVAAADSSRLGFVDIVSLHNQLVTRYGKGDDNGKGASAVQKAINRILEKCGESGGIQALERTFASMDKSGDGEMNKDEMRKGIANFGLKLNSREVDVLFEHFDRDHSGYISMAEFTAGLRSDLTGRRRKLVRMVFDSLDPHGTGVVTVQEMLERYDVSQNPDVKSRKKSPKEALQDFRSNWGRDNRAVTLEEFEDYYKTLSAFIYGDDNFELYLRESWRIPGGVRLSTPAPNREEVRKPVSASGNRRPPTPPPKSHQRAGGDSGPPKLFERHAAAAKLAAAFRGRLGRKEAEHERRKQNAEQLRQQEEEQEASRPRPKNLIRPKAKTYIGF